MKYNLGCGEKTIKGYIGVDSYKRCYPNIVADLNRPLNFAKENTAEEIYASHVIEHLPKWEEFLRECHRILKPGGTLTLKYPQAQCIALNPYHKNLFGSNLMRYYNRYNPEKQFQIIRIKYTWHEKRKILRPISILLSFLANISPKSCDRIWAAYVGGFEDIQIEAKK